MPTYIIGDFNANHPVLGDNTRNNVGEGMARLIRMGKMNHLGPDYPTFLSTSGGSTPDMILGNNKTYHHMGITIGTITTSDHLPMEIIISSKPIRIPCQYGYNYKKAKWEQFADFINEKNRKKRCK